MMGDDDEVNEDGWYDRGGIPDWCIAAAVEIGARCPLLRI
jgi:hypothetical protein